MALVIQTNVASLEAQRNLFKSQNALQTTFNKLSSGLRINTAKDDAAGLAISESLKAQVRTLTVNERNAGDAISMAQTAEGAFGEISNIVLRMRELATQGANGALQSSDRSFIQTEFANLQAEIARIMTSTKFNGKQLITSMKHEIIEKNIGLMSVLIVIAISFGGLVEIIPLTQQDEVTRAAPGIEPYSPLALEGRDIYIREGCYTCHSQMIRPLRGEVERYGHYSLAGESVYDHPFQFGSKRTGPDLARVGGKYSDEWQRLHLMNPRDLVPESNMPGFPWLAKNQVDAELTPKKMTALRKLGVPYSDEQIASANAEVAGKTEMDALIYYLQGLGTASKQWN